MKKKKKIKGPIHPLMTYVIIIIITIIISGILHLLDFQATYYQVNPTTLDLIPNTEIIKSLFNLSGIKFIFKSTVSNFANFTVLSNLIILLMGISIMDKSGFLQTAITLTTKKLKKRTVTFIFVLMCVLASIFGDLSYLIFIPLGALLFYYGKRNPAIGIISSFAALSCGSAINVLFTSTDSSLLNYTLQAIETQRLDYQIKTTAFILIMAVAVILVSYIITVVTENIIAKKLPKYEFTASELEEDIVTKDEKRGMIYALSSAFIYLIIFIYSIIPNLPLSGALLDNNATRYIDKLFSPNAFFSDGFIFVVTLLFIILGLFYGIGVKTIKNHHDFCDNLGHSLDGIGNMLVSIFFASTFISIFKQTNIGNVIVGNIASFISSSNTMGIPLIIIIFLGSAISTLFLPSSISKWAILAPSLIPVAYLSEISPEFTQIIFRFGEAATMNITPVLAYFIVYLAFLEKYNQGEVRIKLTDSIKYQLPYTIIIGCTLLVLLVVWYVIGIPMGISSFPVIS